MNKKISDNNLDNSPNKKPYQKPILKQVELKAEEAVLALCKIGAASGRNQCLASGDLICVRSATS